MDFRDDGFVVIRGRRFDHLRNIVKISPAQQLEAGLLNGKMGTAHLQELHADHLVLRFHPERDPPRAPALTLLLALPRPLMLKRTLQAISSFGVKQIHLFHSTKVEKSFWQSHDLAEAVIEQQLVLGLEQAKDTRLPAVHLHRQWKPFIEQTAPTLAASACALVAHPGTSDTQLPSSLNTATVLAIGPEGGFTEKEIAQLRACGFKTVHCGERILRVETVVPALLGKLLLP